MAETRYAHRFRKVVAACRARGVTVIEEPGCYSRTVGSKDLIAVTSDVVHHTAGGNNASDRRVVRDGRTGLRGPLSQALTETTGVLRLIATGYANHAGSTLNPSYVGNSRSVGNEIVSRGLSSRDFSDAQLRTARIFSEECAREFGYATRWSRGHKEEGVPLGRKVDPAFSMPAHRAALGAATTPAPTPQEDWLMALTDAEQKRLLDRVDALFTREPGLTEDEARQQNEIYRHVRSADTNATAVRQQLLPGGLTHDRLANTEAVAARGKNLTIELLQRPRVSVDQVAQVLAAVEGVPAATVDEAVRRLLALAETPAHADEPPATTTPDRDEQEVSR